MKKILLDTNCYTGLLLGNKKIFSYISKADIIFMTVTVLGELFYGFQGGKKKRKNNELLSTFLQKPSVRIINITSETAEIFGIIKYNLKKAGTPIPINDVWIASSAMETGATIVTLDAHFEKIPGIRIWEY